MDKSIPVFGLIVGLISKEHARIKYANVSGNSSPTLKTDFSIDSNSVGIDEDFKMSLSGSSSFEF